MILFKSRPTVTVSTVHESSSLSLFEELELLLLLLELLLELLLFELLLFELFLVVSELELLLVFPLDNVIEIVVFFANLLPDERDCLIAISLSLLLF